jgi:antitoxin (DNA-binding transcriptional repressor) of toxin-antitoxin stability system
MSTARIEDLKAHAEDLVARVEADGETFEIVYQGRVAALLVPSPEPGPNSESRLGEDDASKQTAEILDRLWALGDEISKDWPKGVSAVDAIRDVRRDP